MSRPRIVSPDTQRGSAKERTPPGQTLTKKWPVLHAGKVPVIDPHSADWRFSVFGACASPYDLTYDELRALPLVDVVCDIHCVTHWSRLENTFTGVPARLLLERARPHPEAKFVMCHAANGFTVNVPLENLMAEDALVTWQWEGKELTPEHGWPLRGLVPRLYFWKSAKWLTGFELRASDAPGFWEQGGYHMHGDPWTEERFGW